MPGLEFAALRAVLSHARGGATPAAPTTSPADAAPSPHLSPEEELVEAIKSTSRVHTAAKEAAVQAAPQATTTGRRTHVACILTGEPSDGFHGSVTSCSNALVSSTIVTGSTTPQQLPLTASGMPSEHPGAPTGSSICMHLGYGIRNLCTPHTSSAATSANTTTNTNTHQVLGSNAPPADATASSRSNKQLSPLQMTQACRMLAVYHESPATGDLHVSHAEDTLHQSFTPAPCSRPVKSTAPGSSSLPVAEKNRKEQRLIAPLYGISEAFAAGAAQQDYMLELVLHDLLHQNVSAGHSGGDAASRAGARACTEAAEALVCKTGRVLGQSNAVCCGSATNDALALRQHSVGTAAAP